MALSARAPVRSSSSELTASLSSSERAASSRTPARRPAVPKTPSRNCRSSEGLLDATLITLVWCTTKRSGWSMSSASSRRSAWRSSSRFIEVAAQVLHTHGGRGSSMRRVPPPPPPPPPPHSHSCTNHSLRQPPTMRRCTTRQRGPPASEKVTATAAFPVVLPWLTSEPRACARSCCEPTASAKHTPSTRQDFPEPLGPTMVVVRASKGPTTTWPAKDLKSLKCTRWRSSASRVAGGRRPALSWADGIGS